MPETSPLFPGHSKLLESSGIDPGVVRDRGYATETSGAALGRLGFNRDQRLTPALVIPVCGLDGKTTLVQIRPDKPRIREGREIKYETPAGSRLILDVPPRVRDKVLDPAVPLLIVEGIRKADAAASRDLACLGTLGVHGWGRDTGTWDRVPLKGRKVFITFDSDVRTNRHVHHAAGKLATFLGDRGAKVGFILLKQADDGSKVGLDDYLAAGRTVEELFALAADELPALPPSERSEQPGTGRYEFTEEGIFEHRTGKNGTTFPVRLANFTARIVEEQVFVEEPERPREFEIEVNLKGKVSRHSLAANAFEPMNWVITQIGGEAVIEPGIGVKDKVRAAIQSHSGTIKLAEIYRRTGWADLDGRGSWGFLHAGGIIRADPRAESGVRPEDRPGGNPCHGKDLGVGDPIMPISDGQSPVPEVRVHLSPTLSRYRFPEPPTGEELIRAIRADLAFLDLAPDRITFPFYAGIFRSVIDVVRYSLFLYGSTGLGKSEFSALVAQHFGHEMDAEHPVESFASTTYAMMAVVHEASHVVVVIEDFVPNGSQGKAQRAHDDADRLFRTMANRVGRNRCRRDGSTQGGKEGNSLILGNGEELPQGESLGARLFSQEVRQGDILDPDDLDKMERLTGYQELARAGTPAMVTAAFVRWLAPRYPDVRDLLRWTRAYHREEAFRGRVDHPRVVDMAADLFAGLDIFVEFIREVGALDESELDRLSERAYAGFFEALDEQRTSHIEQDAGKRFLGLLASAIATGRAHLVPEIEMRPDEELGSPRLWGYVVKTERVPRREACDQKPEMPPRGEARQQDSGENGKPGPTSSEASPQEPEGTGQGPAPNASERSPDQYDEDGEDWEERTYLVPRGQQIGWRHCQNIYLDTELSLSVAQRLAWETGQPPLPPKKTLGKRLASLDVLMSNGKDRNVIKKPIEGVQRKVWHINAFKFYEFFRSWESWEEDRDEEALREREEFEQELGKRELIRSLRLKKARDHMQGHFINLIEPPAVNPPPPIREPEGDPPGQSPQPDGPAIEGFTGGSAEAGGTPGGATTSPPPRQCDDPPPQHGSNGDFMFLD